MKLRFIQDGFVNGELIFKAGNIYEIEAQTSAERWIRRGMAEVVIESKPQPTETQEVMPSVAVSGRKGKKNKERAEELL